MNIHSLLMGAASPASRPRIDPAGRREAILRAALDVFCERSFDGAPVPLVAERAGVAAGTIYRHFPGKEALGNAVYRRWKREMRRALLERMPRGAPPRAGFSHLWHSLWRFAARHPIAFRFLETHHHDDYLDEESRAESRALDAAVEAFVARSQRAGAMREGDPAELIATAFGAFVGLFRAVAEGRLTPTPELERRTGEAVWRMLARVEKAPPGGPSAGRSDSSDRPSAGRPGAATDHEEGEKT